MYLPQGIVGRHYLLSSRKALASVPFAKGDKKGSTEAPSLSPLRIQTALIGSATWKLPGHSSQLATFHSKKSI